MSARDVMSRLDKAPPELLERFRETAGSVPDAELRPMFGQPAAFVGGQMFTGLFGTKWHVKLAEADRTELYGRGGEEFAPMPGRPMKEYVVLPETIVADDAELRDWVSRAHAYVSSLPAKAPKSKGRSARQR